MGISSDLCVDEPNATVDEGSTEPETQQDDSEPDPEAGKQMEETSLVEDATISTEIRLLIRLPSGAQLPVTANCAASVADLKAAVCTQCGLPPELAPKLGLALGHAALEERRSLRANDVCEGDILALYERL